MGRQVHEAPGGQVDLGRQPIYQKLHLFLNAAFSQPTCHAARLEKPQSVRTADTPAWPRAEELVVDVFRAWLTDTGWTVVPPTDPYTDIEAVRDGERLVAEAKGHTSQPGIDADIAYGQLLRRMTAPGAVERYALVVPTAALSHALRVPEHVRARLGIAVYEVTDDGTVAAHGG